MNILDRIWAWLMSIGDDEPVQYTATRRRRLRAQCEFCGKDVAVIASSGKLWRHDCRPPVQPEEEPADALQHDTWEEHAGLR